MDGIRLATIFSNIAEIYKRTQPKEIVFGLNVAARTIRDHPELIQDAYYQGRLYDMAGINKMAAGMISEYIEKGTISAYEEVKSDYQEELIRFIRMSGLGSKRMFDLYEKFDIDTTEKLKEVLYDKDLIKKARKAGISKASLNSIHLERLKHTVAFYEATYDKIARGYIDMWLPRIKRELKKHIDIERLEFTGSYRRRKPYVSDLDILILPAFNFQGLDREKSMKALEDLVNMDSVTGAKDPDIRLGNLSRVYSTDYGFDIEIVLTSGPDWLFDLFITTGDKEHVKKLKGRDATGSVFKAGGLDREIKTEKDLYGRLGLHYIPCELREDADIIVTASRGKIPRLVTVDDIKGDLHIHSEYSDGLIPRDVMHSEAKRLGYEYIALSDHSLSNRYGNGLDENRLDEKIADIRELNSKIDDIEIMVGSEVDIKTKERLDYSDEALAKLDFVIASMHSSYTYSREENTERIIGALKNPLVDMIAHPTGVVFGNRAPYVLDLERILQEAASYGKAMEINSYYLRLDLNEEKVRLAKSLGVPIIINTDSHRLNNLDMIRLGVDIARRAGLGPEHVINTRGLKDFLYWKRNK